MKNFNFSKLEKVFIVAEIGVNHEGDFATAEDLIIKAKKSGVDAVKFQTYNFKKYVSTIQLERQDRVKKFQLTKNQFLRLSKKAKELGLIFFSTPLHFDDVDFLTKFCPIIKISSGDLTHLDLLKYVAKKKKPIILSTGLGTKDEIKKAINVIEKNKRQKDELLIMHCVSAYPTPPEEVNLQNINWLKDTFDYPVGYSDHTIGPKACELSVMLGVKVIEKHFTYRKENQSFHDHHISADPSDMKKIVKKIRFAELMYGNYARSRGESEKKNLQHMRRSFALTRNLKKGEKIKADDLLLLRPAWGFLPDEKEKLLGSKLNKNLSAGMLIGKDDIN